MPDLSKSASEVAPALVLLSLARIRVLSAKQPKREPIEVPPHRCKAMYGLREDVALVRIDDEFNRRSVLPQGAEHLQAERRFFCTGLHEHRYLHATRVEGW
jgi:hypothetical protein